VAVAGKAQDESDEEMGDRAPEDNDQLSQLPYINGEDDDSIPNVDPEPYPEDNGDLYERPSPIRPSGRKRRRVDAAAKIESHHGDIEDDQSAIAVDTKNDDDDTQDTDDNSTLNGDASPLSLNDPGTEVAVSTDATSITDDDEAQIQRETEDYYGPPVPQAGVRSRRSLPRVSYVQPILDTFSDEELDIQLDDDDESDVYQSNASVLESVVDEDSEHEDFTDERSSDDGENEQVDNDEEEEEEEEEATVVLDSKPASAKSKSRVKKKPSDGQDGKGIDFNLPPIDNIDDAFADMAAKAVELGLVNALDKLNGRRISVATMCSGTESPLLAFELLSKALKKAGQPSLNVHQKFAAEIEVFKQAFIERNQSPEIIFRDVREFIPDDATTAITAYGAEAEIPSGLDVLIAGFVCKDLSRLNSQPKSLDDGGESGDTWRAIYSYAKRFRPSIVLLENVKGLSKLWNEVVSKWDNIGYEAAWLIRDTKRYHIPQTRERMYMIAIERSHYGKNANKAVIHWQDLMEKLQRQCSSPYEAWLKNMLNESSDHSALISEVDWALCKLRYDHIRSEERLGILRPVTKWSENGTVRYVSNN
jgi:hypothetical protein